MKPKYVIVQDSSSPYFPSPGVLYPFEVFERLATTAASLPNDDCTDVTVVFDNHQEFACTLYLNPQESLCVQDYLSDLQVHLAKEQHDVNDQNILQDFLKAIQWTLH